MAQGVKNPPSFQKNQVQSLGQEVCLEAEIATHSSILAWKTPWTEEPRGLQSMTRKESDATEVTEGAHTQGLRSRRIKSITQQCICVLLF